MFELRLCGTLWLLRLVWYAWWDAIDLERWRLLQISVQNRMIRLEETWIHTGQGVMSTEAVKKTTTTHRQVWVKGSFQPVWIICNQGYWVGAGAELKLMELNHRPDQEKSRSCIQTPTTMTCNNANVSSKPNDRIYCVLSSLIFQCEAPPPSAGLHPVSNLHNCYIWPLPNALY